MTTIIAANESLAEAFKNSEKVDTGLLTILEYVEIRMEFDFRDNPALITETRKAIKHFISTGAKFLGCGTNRICFAYNYNQVTKIPFTFRGYEASSHEARTSESFLKSPNECYTPVADCELFTVDGINIWLLVMERIYNFPKRGEKLPEWTQSVDCAQVGYNSKGELVAFDL